MTATLLPETSTVAVEELEQFLEVGEPWPAEICKQLGQLRPATLRDILRATKMRTCLRRPFVDAANLDPAAEADLNVLLRGQFHRKRAKPATTIGYLIMLLKWQFHHVVQNA